ncbi:MAG: DUF4292 domain-containing protein [Prevotellaceae bacterium]|nr:DUF4292 domain-containing protein [Prevotellaceae bacterium]
MRSNRLIIKIALIAMVFAFASCGTKKALSDGGSSVAGTSDASNAETVKLNFLRKVYDNEAYTQNISSKIKFTIKNGSKDISVAGTMRMKKDDVIRIQLTPLGLMEVGRLEFTKDYVLIVDRMNKEYIKADYNKVDFLQRNGLDFYALQALFWNQLYIPGTQKITDSSLKSFDVTFDETSSNSTISLKKGNLSYQWKADNNTAQIREVNVGYTSKSTGNTNVNCVYDSFKSLGTKTFPTDMTMSVQTDAVKKANDVSVNISISSFDTSSDWETRTSVSDKYKQVDAQDVINRLLKM